jgi:serine/threonine protein kinase HipA of HipAB toxin-antitoxin module
MKTYNTFDIMYPSLNMARRHLINIIETGEQQDNLLSARQEARASYDAAWETFEKQFEGKSK